jgi:hypothetical protein
LLFSDDYHASACTVLYFALLFKCVYNYANGGAQLRRGHCHESAAADPLSC